MSDPSANNTFFNSSFMPWIITMPESQRITFLVCYALILILSVLGNTSIIAIVARNPSMRSTIDYLIANMAATDLAASVAIMGLNFSILHNRSKAFEVSGVLGNIFCKLGPYIRDVSISVSIQSMVAIAFDRFFAVVFPMRATPRLFRLRVVLPVIWCLSLGIFTVHLVTYRLVSPTQEVDVCFPIWFNRVHLMKAYTIFYFSILTVFLLLPLVTIAILYTIIALKMWRQTSPGQQSSEAEEARRRRNKGIVKMAFTIVLFFFLFWFPYHVVMLIDFFVWKGSAPNGVDPYLLSILNDTLTIISYLSFVINPYICLTFSSKFREAFRNLFSFCHCFTTRVAPVGISP